MAIILSMLFIAIPAAPAQADRDIDLDPEEGEIGDEIDITGTEFNASTSETDRYANIYFSNQEADTYDSIDDEVDIYEVLRSGVWLDEEGDFDTTITIPSEMTDGDDEEDVTSGTYYIYVCHDGADNIRAFAEFTVIGGEIEIDPEEGPVGTVVQITGIGFASDEEIAIEFDGDEVDIEDDDETDNDGEFDSVIVVPDSTAGAQTITVTISGTEATAEFTVESEITLDPQSGEAATDVDVSGTGFGRRQDVVIYFGTESVATKTTGSNGSFDITFTIPELDAGIYDVEVEDEDENLDTAKFTITAPSPAPTPEPPPEPTPPPSSTAGSVSPESGSIGTQLVLSGTGFEVGKTVTVKYGNEKVATATAAAGGVFIAAFNVPASNHGEHTITASDGTNVLELTFTVESEAPATPVPLLPQMGVEIKPPIIFDWEDVTDASVPVTYTLQIATDDDFDAGSIALEKKALEKSEYVLTADEEQELTPAITYYWRIRAIDAASNEGAWTGAEEFSAKASFSIPEWAQYTLFGLGGLFLLLIGYWLGRRSGGYY